jgi:hypothetical protein
MENLARWALAQAFGLSVMLALVFRDNYRSPLPALPDAGLFLAHYGIQASALGMSLAVWPLTDLVFRATSPDRQWQCAGAFNRWAAALLLYFACVHAALLGLSAMTEPEAIRSALAPGFFRGYASFIAGTALLSLLYVVRLEFLAFRGQTAGVEGTRPR